MAKAMQEKKWDMKDMKMWGMHKVLMGVGLIIFGLVLGAASRTALDTNLNWHGAFMVLGILVILKGLWMWTKTS